MAFAFTLPELGENIETGEVVRVLVSVGDTVALDQPVVELETDKATIEVPSPVAGTVAGVPVKAGDTIAVGQVILTIDDGDGHDAGVTAAALKNEATASGLPAFESAEPSEPIEPPKPVSPLESPSSPLPSTPAPPPVTTAPVSMPTPMPTVGRVLAAPSIRRLAREFGVDIAEVSGTGARGRVTADDVKAHSRQVLEQARLAPGRVQTPVATGLPDFAKWGAVERAPMRGIRRATARHMREAWTIPHVTQHDRADVSYFEATRQRIKRDRPDLPLTVTAFVVKILAAALRVFPQFNASLDTTRAEVVYKQYISIGVAVDTERGLIVPVVRNADQKTLTQISTEIAELAGKARSKAVTVEDLQGGSFTLTNLGGLGGTLFTPIINHPEVAILGLSRAAPEPVLVDGAFQPRLLLPLSLSYDHRLIDGADAVRFLRWVADRIEHPLLLGLE